MKDENCLFCKIAAKEIPAEIVYEDENSLAFLDINPTHKGHTLLIPKKHFRNLLEMNEVDIGLMNRALSFLPNKIKEAVDADGLVISTNQERPAQEVFHTHWHIMPRYLDDNFTNWPKVKYEEGEEKKYADKIRNVI